jgi:hypothetical protein
VDVRLAVIVGVLVVDKRAILELCVLCFMVMERWVLGRVTRGLYATLLTARCVCPRRLRTRAVSAMFFALGNSVISVSVALLA